MQICCTAIRVAQSGRHKSANVSEASGLLSRTFMAHRKELGRFLALRCGRDGAEDLLQELWIKVRQSDMVVERPLPYLYRMAHRLVLDNRRGAYRAVERDHSWSIINGHAEEGEAALAERHLLAREKLAVVERTLARVGSRATRIFMRYRLDGVEQRRIAEELGVSLSTVEKDLQRSYAALASLKGDRDEG
jgi:RNA polymerase sigma factor (sigma-70 family)